MGGVEAAKDGSAERLCATDAAKAYKRGLALCGEGSYDKALIVSFWPPSSDVAAFYFACRFRLVRHVCTVIAVQQHSPRTSSATHQQAGSSLNRETPTRTVALYIRD